MVMITYATHNIECVSCATVADSGLSKVVVHTDPYTSPKSFTASA